jgi:hypothetical protein
MKMAPGNLLKRHYASCILSLIFVIIALRSALLIYPDLNLTYPFLAPDSYDWIANGICHEGYDVNCSFRPPALPLIIAGLDALGILDLLPALNQLVLFGMLFIAYRMTARWFGRPASVLVTLILFFNYFLQNLSLYILADIYAAFFILAGVYCYAGAESDERNYGYAALWLSVSYMFQSAVVFVMPALLVHWVFFRERLGLKNIIRTALPPLLLIGGWLIYKKARFGSVPPYSVQQAALLKLHSSSILFYLINTVSVLSVGFFLLVLLGIAGAAAVRENRIRSFLCLNALVSAGWFAFWVFCYTWNDRRFIVYLLFFLVPFAAVAVAYGVSLFARANALGKALLIGPYIAIVAGSSIPYGCCFMYDMVKLTATTAIQFRAITDEASCNGNIDGTSFRVVKDRSGLSPLNLRALYAMRRNINPGEVRALRKIRDEISRRNIDVLCAEYDNPDRFRWYIDRNRYGNYFKKRIRSYPDCGTPNMRITPSGISLQ